MTTTTKKKRTTRTEHIDVTFDENGHAEGWAFLVKKAFRPALDIKITEIVKNKKKTQTWTRGIPPVFSFDVGDTLFSRDRKHFVQVIKVSENTVFFDIGVEQNSQYHRKKNQSCSQQDFAKILRKGIAG